MDEELNSFFNEYQDNFMEYFETHKIKKLQNRKDFKEISNEIVELKNKYPNVQAYLEDEQIVDLSEKEREIVLKIIDLEDDLVTLEIKESFKLVSLSIVAYAVDPLCAATTLPFKSASVFIPESANTTNICGFDI